MEKLKQRIEKDGQVLSSSVLKVNSFLNHGIDPELIDAIGQEFASAFTGQGISKVITIESGGIAPAYAAAGYLHVPMVYAKKAEPSTMSHPLSASVYSYTKQKTYSICIEEELLQKGDVVLFIDDFLANGGAFEGIQELVTKSGARLGGVGICIEKAWQDGSALVRRSGIPLCVLASIASMSRENGIVWNH